MHNTLQATDRRFPTIPRLVFLGLRRCSTPCRRAGSVCGRLIHTSDHLWREVQHWRKGEDAGRRGAIRQDETVSLSLPKLTDHLANGQEKLLGFIGLLFTEFLHGIGHELVGILDQTLQVARAWVVDASVWVRKAV